jgi:glucose uptake protein GlcU
MKLDAGKLIGYAAMAVGVVGTVLTSIANQKQMDSKIAEEVAKKVADSNK